MTATNFAQSLLTCVTLLMKYHSTAQWLWQQRAVPETSLRLKLKITEQLQHLVESPQYVANRAAALVRCRRVLKEKNGKVVNKDVYLPIPSLHVRDCHWFVVFALF